ncbi:GlxA family transcriptional regulator [Enterobacter sp. CC120223-11]|uniref:GlxA family transcriptional regulator n=1 Tax=Enterobacter sp. CC120223-11 TaxID=1378073 RepID=UPI000BD0DAF3|nr:helix-turn-helix domain-containing protein [Enterobacter sp. CC120223-11]SNY79345.1 Transcriptional regulator GlxA family, contains an amidase domain and an AraC-type DNA-binding HTH domain [Enterobacter sp. CC120223-11]
MKRTIAILAVPGVQLLDVSGPLDVFAEANTLLHREVYDLKIVTLEADTVRASSGIEVMGHLRLDDCETFRPDTFLVAGMPNAARRTFSHDVTAGIKTLCERSRRYGSICTGAFLLAEAGVLTNRSVTTHWSSADDLAKAHPDLRVDKDALYVADGPVRTAAGVTSGMDLALRLVEEDLGGELAKDIAGNLVMFFRRPVNQGHYVRSAELSLSGREALQELQRWAITHLGSIHSLKDLADHIGLSTRHLNRLFQQQLNTRPGEWLEACRISQVKQMLESSDVPLKTIASAVGYSSADSLRRAFIRQMGMTPPMYRRLHLRSVY